LTPRLDVALAVAAGAIVTTVIETRDDVRWLRRAVQELLDHAGLELPADTGDEE
jgi:hypothetical protein